MATRTDVSTRKSNQTQTQERTAEPTPLRPPVDIFEDSDGITLLADLPGVSKDRLSMQVDHDTLMIQGDVQIDMPEGMAAMYADVRSTRYRRSFALSKELATDDIEASIKDGVLQVRIPKRMEARPRKIEVQPY